MVYIYSQRGQMPRTWDMEFMSHGEYMCPCIYPENGWYVVCSAQSKPFHIFAHTIYLVLINCTYFSFWPWPNCISGQGHKNTFLHVVCMTGGTLCVRLSLNHITNLHILFDISFALTMTSAESSQGHTQHQISLSFKVDVLYIYIASLAIAQYHVK